MADFPDIVDRNVQYPNRFLSSEVEPGVIELTPDPGAGETGTELNAELFDGIKEYIDQPSFSEYLSDGTNLNNEMTPGIYAMSGSHTYANNPAPGMWGFLEVSTNTTGAVMRQVASRTNGVRYERWYTTGPWTGWREVAPHDSGWVPITSADTNYYNSYAYVRKVGNVVYLRGRISRADSAPFEDGWTPGIIPAGYRPLATSVVMCAGANVTGASAFFKVSINATTGMITVLANPASGGSSSVYFDGLSWTVD